MVNRSRPRGKFALILVAFASLSFTVSAARTAQAPSDAADIPKTPPGKQFSTWLSVFNSGDKADFEKFRSQFDKPEDHKVEGMLGFRRQTGGFDLRKIEDSTGTELTALVQERDSDQFARLKIEVEAAAPNKITHLDVRAIERPAEFALARLSQSDLIARFGQSWTRKLQPTNSLALCSWPKTASRFSPALTAWPTAKRKSPTRSTQNSASAR